LFSSYVLNILLRALIAVFQVSSFLLISTFLDISEIANYSLYTAILGYSVIFGNLNIYLPLCLKLMQGNYSSGEVVIRYFFFVRYFWLIAFPVALYLYYILMPSSAWIVLFALNLILFLLNSFTENLLFASKMPVKSSLLVLSRGAWFIPVSVFLFFNGSIDVLNIISVNLLLEFFLFIYSARYIRRIYRKSELNIIGCWDTLWPIIRSGFSYTLIGLLLLASLYGPRFALEHYFDMSIAGAFYVLYSLVSIPAIILESGVFSVILPRLAKEMTGHVLRLYFIITLVCVVALLLYYFSLYFMVDLIYSFFGKSSAVPSDLLFFVYTAFGVLYFILRSYHHYLYSRGMHVILLIGYFFGAFFSLLSYGFTIESFGLMGAGYALFVFAIVTISVFSFSHLTRLKI